MLSILVLTVMLTRLQHACCNITMYSTSQIKKLYDKFLIKYPRDFDNDTISYRKRLKIFQENVQLIEKLNNENSTATYEITKFADWDDEELDAFSGPLPRLDRYVFRYHGAGWIYVISDGSSYPSHWDWREKGGVTAVKQQSYNCNSCYAYAVTAVIESLYAIKYHQYISISEYEMLDCDYTNNGCGSGSIMKSLARGKYIGYTQMINYPTLLWNNYFCPAYGEIFINKLYQIDPDPNAMAWFVANVAPVALNLAFPKRYKFYKSGVLPDNEECSAMEPNHAAEVIGYGTENGKKYWLIKNSWGEWWGDHGFFKIERGINACQVETYVASAGL
ncbi:papain family cysteine protease containing protein [Loa loa]|uniref:Papain family cysteine protease containing protein n=1 Tax=Loa loa TaxID=7209 RepID=A0A1I7W3V7_LOALO|nr:papain family cysteine protease containing protein [Loa loa]EFO27054.1 papain family cysteine protease containing protein [Loa loa]